MESYYYWQITTKSCFFGNMHIFNRSVIHTMHVTPISMILDWEMWGIWIITDTPANDNYSTEFEVNYVVNY